MSSEDARSEETRLRTATEADIPAIIRLWEQLQDHHIARNPELFERIPESWLTTCIRFNLRSPVSDFLLAERAGRSCGFALVGVETPTHPGFRQVRRGVLYELVVEKRSRRSGVGRRLVEAARSWCHRRGAAEVALCVFESNPEALAFYEKTGWRCEMRRLVSGTEELKPDPSA